MANSTAPADRVVLNAGGLHVETTISTLTRLYPESVLAAMVNKNWAPNNPEKEIWIDATAEVFPWILEFLRRGPQAVLPPDLPTLSLLRMDASYFLLSDLVRLVESKIAELVPPAFKVGETVKMNCIAPGDSFNYCPNPSDMKFVVCYDELAGAGIQPDLCPIVTCGNCCAIFNERLYAPNPKQLLGEFLRKPNPTGIVLFVHKEGKCVDVNWRCEDFCLIVHMRPEFLLKV